MADAVAEQIAALRDEDWAIREEAAMMLGTLRDPRAVAPLVSMLHDGDRAVRDAAIGALLAIGESAVMPLGACLSDPVLTVQELASSVLATIADVRVLTQLIAALASSDWIVRMHAAKALGRIQDPQAVGPLVPLLQDKVKAVREEASTALAAIGEAALSSLLDALTHVEWLVRLHAVEALGKTKSPEAVVPLLSVLFNDRDRAVREDAVRALGQIGDLRAVEFLVTVMREPGLRPLAVDALGEIGDRRTVPVLIDVLEGVGRPEVSMPIDGCGDQWGEERITLGAAARALGAIRDEAAIPALIKALGYTVTRADAADALARFGGVVIAPLLALLAHEPDDNLRYHVKETLARVGWRAGRI
ncbi:MAG: HEAT repeat domain-containing protein [Nitrospiraceae bacterium]|jgi:HEAT repeat protein|nr:HEAT repeat domain-containing protein [Nitrospiraceae bacterium]